MWLKLLNAPWPEQNDVPEQVRQQATQRLHSYWRAQIWPFVVGEVALWLIGQWQGVPRARAYVLPVILMSIVYGLGLLRRYELFWLIGTVILFEAQGMLIQGLGTVTAVAFLLPYTFAGMILAGRKRVFVQACCVVAFWLSLFYELPTNGLRLNPPHYLTVCYDILMAAFTFQALRFLNRLSIELNTSYVEQAVTQQVTERSQQFLARVSHELRTPLNSVLGFAKLMRRIELPTPQAGYLNQIVDEGEQLNHIVGDLLDSAQLSAGRLILRPGTCDVNAICQAIAEEIRPILKPGVALGTSLSPGLAPIQADGMRVRQIVRNLVGNAAKYTMHGQIEIRTDQKDRVIQVAVCDSGPGIPADQRDRVFAPFVKRDQRSPGVGLGLDIARQLARLHGGDIHLQSEVGQGSTFTVELPLMPATGFSENHSEISQH